MEQELSEAGKKTYELIDLPGLCATISHSEFTIGDCIERKWGEH
jgi:hypothetical protein